MSVQPINAHRSQRKPPKVELHSTESEEAVLGAALLDEHALEWVIANLRWEDYYRPAHRQVHTTVTQLAKDGVPVDVKTVAGAMEHEGTLADVGGHPFLIHLLEAVPTASNVGYYGRTVHKLARLRRLRDLFTQGIALVEQADTDPDRVLAVAQGWLDEQASDGEQLGLRPDDLLEAIRERQRAINAGKAATWGLVGLDELCGPLLPGQVTLVAALPSMGKSSLAIQVAAHNAESAHVLYVTYEMTPADTGQHTLAGITGHSLDQTAAFVDSLSMEGARQAHAALDLTVFTHYPDPEALLGQVRALHARRPLLLVAVDYVQKVPAVRGRRHTTREQEVAETSALLKTMAIRCDVPVLACAQLNRGAVGRRPGLADLRESGALEQDADKVLFISKASRDARTADLLLEKNRMGPIGERRLAWNAKQATFGDL